MHPDEPAERSRAPPGEVADKPDDAYYITVSDGDTTFGYLARWRSGEWMYVSEDAATYFDWTDETDSH